MGPTNSLQAKTESPNSIRGRFGTDGTRNAAHGSDSAASAARELEFFFSAKSALKSPAYLNNCTCMVIKPHIITERFVGQIIDIVLNAGFEISALQMFWLDKPSAEVTTFLFRNSWKFIKQSSVISIWSCKSSLTDPVSLWKSARITLCKYSESYVVLLTLSWPEQ